MFGFGKKIKDPVRGVGQVVGATGVGDATHQTCRITMVVQAEGIGPYSVEHKCTAKAVKWPRPGMTLPVTVSRSDPQRLRVEWDEVPEWSELVRDQAAAMAERMRSGPAAAMPQAEPYDPSNPAHAQAIRAAEAMTGMDLDGDGTIAGAAPRGDRVAQLERLAALHRSGALTDAEFEAEKARLLG